MASKYRSFLTSLHTGLDLKNELSRFQIITKVPYPNKSDRWTNAKREVDAKWYYWQTALKLIQVMASK